MTDPFVANPPSLPLLEKAAQMCGQGLDYLINDCIIGKLGSALDAGCSSIRGMGAKGINIGGGGLAGDISCAAPQGPSSSPSLSQQQGQKIERSGPEITPQIQKSVSAVNMDFAKDHAIRQSSIQQGMNFGGQDLCNFAAPSTPGCGVGMAQGQSASR